MVLIANAPRATPASTTPAATHPALGRVLMLDDAAVVNESSVTALGGDDRVVTAPLPRSTVASESDTGYPEPTAGGVDA